MAGLRKEVVTVLSCDSHHLTQNSFMTEFTRMEEVAWSFVGFPPYMASHCISIDA